MATDMQASDWPITYDGSVARINRAVVRSTDELFSLLITYREVARAAFQGAADISVTEPVLEYFLDIQAGTFTISAEVRSMAEAEAVMAQSAALEKLTDQLPPIYDEPDQPSGPTGPGSGPGPGPGLPPGE